MTNKLVLDQIVIPLPELGSFILTYIYLGLLLTVAYGIFAKDRSKHGHLTTVIVFVAMMFLWPYLIIAVIREHNIFLREKNLLDEFEDSIGGDD